VFADDDLITTKMSLKFMADEYSLSEQMRPTQTASPTASSLSAVLPPPIWQHKHWLTLVTGQDTERPQTPWVNPPDVHHNWEPEPLRWIGIRFTRALMKVVDRIEYREGPWSHG